MMFFRDLPTTWLVCRSDRLFCRTGVTKIATERAFCIKTGTEMNYSSDKFGPSMKI